MMQYIGDFFGWIMYFCYKLVHNYGLTIILFTLLTRIVLLPVSIMVQKNSIKMVKMYPEMNRIKAKNFGNKDMISEEQYALYKKNKYNPMLDLVPVFLQLVILMGVVDVIYKPLRQLLRISQDTIDKAVNVFCSLTGTSDKVSSVQVQLVSYVSDLTDIFNNGAETAAEVAAYDSFLASISSDVYEQIQSLDLTFCGFDLGVVPSQVGGISILVPILAAASAWLMCFTQNKSNVLQSEQGKVNQYGTMAFSVALSLYLGYFVPAGVGFYWILGNLFSIVQMYILNACINPKKYIDYEALEESKKELAEVTKYANEAKKARDKEEVAREKADYKRFFKYGPMQIVFYSEKNGFYKYFKDVIEYILAKTDIVIHYITSDPKDEVFKMQSDNFQVYYIGENKLIVLMMKLDADICVMTMPDLQKYQIKRSMIRNDIEYIYMDHAVASANLTLRKHALDNFDTIFATNELMKLEMRKMEEVYNLKEKTIVEYGYSLIDNMIANYEKEQKAKAGEENVSVKEAVNTRLEQMKDETASDSIEQKKDGAQNAETNSTKNLVPEILIAPSWQESNILDSCISQILDNLLGQGYHITVRPHPQYVRHCEEKLLALKDKYKDHEDFELQLDFSSNKTVFNADILITDWSGIAYEYSFTTLKPTLFINTPMKIMNPDYKEVDIVPFDIEARDQIGISVDTDKLDTLAEVVHRLLTEEVYAKDSMKSVREKYLYNVDKSAEVGAKYIIKQLIAASKR